MDFPAFVKVTFWNIGANFIYELRFRSLNVVIVSFFPRGLTLALRSERQDDDFGRGASVMLRIAVPS